MDAPAAARLRDLPRDQCLELLAAVSLGRIGVSIGALPVILPVNFVLVRDHIVFRTVPGTKLDAAIVRRVVAFEADDHEPDGAWGWSVLVQGVASEIVDPDEVAEVRAVPLSTWPFENGTANRFVRVETTRVSGRRFGRLPALSRSLLPAPEAD
jgi:uncharacterized protein